MRKGREGAVLFLDQNPSAEQGTHIAVLHMGADEQSSANSEFTMELGSARIFQMHRAFL